MTATDELRKLLDERGVECTTRDGMKATSITHITHWYADGVDAEFTEQIKGCTRLTASGLTPEQAIAATLGSETCEVVGSYYYDDYDQYEFEFSCGHSVNMYDKEPPNYCPSCGKAVKR